MIVRKRTNRRAKALLACGGLLALGAAGLGTASPAGAHASAPAAATFGFLPNQSGGTGALGTTPPYSPGAFTTIYLRAAGEQSTNFNGNPDTNVEIKAIVPAGWTSPQCGPAKLGINNASTNNTNQPGADAPGWSCAVVNEGGHDVVRWSGPQVVAPATNADAPSFFVFSVVTPTPAVQTTYDGTNGNEGFIVDQKYASGAVSHWIPSLSQPGVEPPGTERTDVASGLVRTVAGAGSVFHPVTPVRILDSRSTLGGWNASLGAGANRALTVTGGAASVPNDARAVVLNVTATGATESTYLTVYPTGSSAPNASNLNVVPSRDVANQVVVKVGTAGQISIANAAGSVHVIADIVGWYDGAGGSRFNALTPTRVLDSRGATGGFGGALGTRTAKTLQVAGVSGVANTATAVVLNVTATDATAGTFVTVWPSGQARPTVSNLNLVPGRTVANLVTVAVGGDGKIAVDNDAGSVHVIADVVGYYDSTGDLFHVLSPGRILDSRGSAGGFGGALAGGAGKYLVVRGQGGVRMDATAVVGTATATGPASGGYLTVAPAGATGTSSTLNFEAGDNVPNLVVAKVGTGNALSFTTTATSTHVLFDVVGFFAGV